MAEKKCLFCDIIAGKLPATVIDQDDNVIVVKDIAPKAPIHYLIIPKIHVADVSSLDEHTAHIMAKIALMAKKVAKEKLNDAPFRLCINNGAGVGQSVFHLHCHFLAGKTMTDL